MVGPVNVELAGVAQSVWNLKRRMVVPLLPRFTKNAGSPFGGLMGPSTFDDNKRREMYRELHKITRDEAAWIFLFNTQDNYGMKSTVKGLNPTADGYFYVKDLSLG